MIYQSTKILDLGSCAFRQWRADHSHCHFVHGYKLQAKFWFDCTELDNKNWVVDFGGLKELKAALEKQFDHTLCIAADDPLLSNFKQLHDLGAVDLRIMAEGVGIERTAEWCLKVSDSIIRKQTNGRCWVSRVEVWEHDKNSAIVFSSNDEHLKNTKTHTDVPLHTTVAAPAPEIQQTISATIQPNIELQPRGANVGNNVTTGWGDLFKGTTWG